MEELEALITLARAPDTNTAHRHDAFAALVARFQDIAYGYAFAILGDTYLAQDAAQEAFLVAYQNLDQLRESRAFLGWLRRIILTQTNRLTRTKRVRVQSFEEDSQIPSDQPDLIAVIERRELCQQIRGAIESLPEQQRITIVLYYINDYSQHEIAEFLGMSVDAVKKLLQRARSQLQHRMMDMVKDDLRKQRPSRNDALVRSVRLFTSFQAAAEQSELSMIELMLVDGVDVNATDEEGRTLLHWAARQGNLDAAELLVKSGMALDAKDQFGKTPLQEAVERGHTKVAQLLRQHTNS